MKHYFHFILFFVLLYLIYISFFKNQIVESLQIKDKILTQCNDWYCNKGEGGHILEWCEKEGSRCSEEGHWVCKKDGGPDGDGVFRWCATNADYTQVDPTYNYNADDYIDGNHHKEKCLNEGLDIKNWKSWDVQIKDSITAFKCPNVKNKDDISDEKQHSFLGVNYNTYAQPLDTTEYKKVVIPQDKNFNDLQKLYEQNNIIPSHKTKALKFADIASKPEEETGDDDNSTTNSTTNSA